MRTGTVVLVAIGLLASSGCTSTVPGVAVRDAYAAPTDVRPLQESQLDDVMLGPGQLDAIIGASGLNVVVDSDQMSDNSEAVSDPDCLGSIFGAEDLVYRSSGWTAVRDQIAHEPGDSNRHWIEQTVVLYPEAKQAKDFVVNAASSWRDCSGFSVAVDDRTTSSIWLIGDVSMREDVVTQVVAQEDSDGWECQHALTAVANLSVEALACAFGIDDEAVDVVHQLVANAAKQR